MKKKTVYKLLLEFVLIFSAVTLSFIAEDYRQNSQLRDLERATLKGILTDLEYDQDQLKTILYFDSLKLATTEELNGVLSSDDPDKENVEYVVSEFFGGTTFNLTNSHYESLSSSGMLKEITSEDLRNQLINYYDSFGSHLKSVSELYQSEYFNFMHSLDKLGVFRGVEFNVRDHQVLVNDIEWKGKLSRVYTFTQMFNPQYERMLEFNRSLYEKISKELES